MEELGDFSSKNYEYMQLGSGEGNIDHNDKYVIFTAKERNNDNVIAILFDIEKRKEIWTKEL